MKISDEPVRAAVKKFLTVAQSSVVKPSSNFFNSTHGGFISGSVYVSGSPELTKAREECRSQIFRSTGFGPSLISETEIDNLLNRMAAKQCASGSDETSTFLEEITQSCLSEVDCILPNYIIHLDNEINSYAIGPITIMRTDDIRVKFSKIDRAKIIFKSENPGVLQPDGGISLSYPEYCFAVRLQCSPNRRVSLAHWYVDIGSSLLRIFARGAGIFNALSPNIGDRDPSPFYFDDGLSSHVVVNFNDDGISYGGWTAGRHYLITNKSVSVLADRQFDTIANKVFFPAKNSVADRLHRALGWLAKGRQAQELATRFLFFFTALESLLTNNSAAAPVTETISRNVATMISETDHRFSTYKILKKLYSARSETVHSGSREIPESSCNMLQIIVEMTCYVALTKAIDKHEGEFLAELAEAGFGSPWPRDGKQSI